MLMPGLATLILLAALPETPKPPWGREAVALALRELGEPSLPQGEQPVRVVRLVIAPPFPRWRIVLTRLTPQEGGVEVITKTLTQWFPGPSVGKSFPRQRLAPSRWKEIERQLVPGLWSLHPDPFPNPIVADGYAWYLESSGPRGHAEVIQHEPQDGPFREVCQYLLRLSAIDVAPDEFISWFAPR